MATKTSNLVAAKEAIVIVVGARPIKYAQIQVRHNRTNEIVTMDNNNDIVDPGDEGIPYAFKANERVAKNHPAVLANPGAFVPADEADDPVPA